MVNALSEHLIFKKKNLSSPFTKLTCSLVIGDSFFWDPHWTLRMWAPHLCPEGNQGIQCLAAGTLGPGSYATESTSLGWFVDKVGMTRTLQMFEKSLCLNTVTVFFVCSVPSMFPPLGWGGEHYYLCQELFWQERNDKRQGSEKKRS